MESNNKNTFHLESLLGITSDKEGLEALSTIPSLLSALIDILKIKNGRKSDQAAAILINISADEKGAQALLNLENNTQKTQLCIVKELFDIILDPESEISDQCCKILSNLTCQEFLAEKVLDSLENSGISLDKIASIFNKTNFNKKGAKLDYLGLVFSNLSQTPRGRRLILDREKCIIQRLLPYTEYKDSLIKRKGVIGMLRNCCFETEHHKWLLNEDVDILPSLLLPLAGNTEFEEEENDKLPLQLQYLPEEKERDDDPEIRCMLIEAITLLCSKRENREFIRSKNTYLILRELHKWEQDRKVLLACENLVNILIRTEEEIGEDNLQELEVPKHLQAKFTELNDELLEKN